MVQTLEAFKRHKPNIGEHDLFEDKLLFDFIENYLPVTYHTYKNAETTVDIPIIINSSFPENALALKLTNHLRELST
jgi:hypothetical protein